MRKSHTHWNSWSFSGVRRQLRRQNFGLNQSSNGRIFKWYMIQYVSFPLNYRYCMLSRCENGFPVLVRFRNGYVFKWCSVRMENIAMILHSCSVRGIIIFWSVIPWYEMQICFSEVCLFLNGLIFKSLNRHIVQHLEGYMVRTCSLDRVDENSVNKTWSAELFDTHF